MNVSDLSSLVLTDQQRTTLIANAAAADAAGFDAHQLATLVGVPVAALAVALRDPTLVAEIEAVKLRGALDGSLLKTKAIAVIDTALPRLQAAVDSDALDPAEVADVMAKSLRVVERQDRVDAQQDGGRRYPTVFINFGPAGITANVVQPPKATDDVIDMEQPSRSERR